MGTQSHKLASFREFDLGYSFRAREETPPTGKEGIMSQTKQGRAGTGSEAGAEGKTQTTKDLILDKAQELILERGYENVSIDDIVSACGLTKGAFYYNFKSKKDLLNYPVTRYQFDAVAESIKTSGKRSAYERIFAYVGQWLKYHEDNGTSMARAWMIQHTDPTYHSESNAGNDAFADDKAYITQFIQDAVEQGELSRDTPVDFLGTSIALMLYGRVYSELLTNDPEKPTDWAREWLIPQLKSVMFAPYRVGAESAE